MLLSVFGNHGSSAPCQLYRFCVALSSFGLQESIDWEENVLRSGPISILALRKVFRRMGWARSIYLTYSELSKVSQLQRMDCCVSDEDTIGIWDGQFFIVWDWSSSYRMFNFPFLCPIGKGNPPVIVRSKNTDTHFQLSPGET